MELDLTEDEILVKNSARDFARREIEPFVSLHLSVLLAATLVGISFWLAHAHHERQQLALL